MKTTLILSALLIGLASNAYASTHSEKMYRDLIRPDGKPRSDAVYSTAVDGCYAQTHESRTALYDTPAYKACMLQKGYRYLWTKVLQDPVHTTTYATKQSDDDGSAQREANDDAQRQAQWQQQMSQENDDEQASMDAANASYAADAAQAAANVSAAASFDAQMTVGN
jgi:hypothetical protein